MNHCNFLLLRTPLQTLNHAYDFKTELPPIFLEGIHLASPEFLQEIQRNKSLQNKENAKIKLSLLKYWLRSCTRCTPYGTFAGSIVTKISDDPTSVILRDSNEHIKKVRIDMNYISAIVDKIEKIISIQSQLRFYPNNSLYETFNEFRYAEYVTIDNRRIYKLTSIEKEDYLLLLLDFSKDGKTMGELVSQLVSFIDVSSGEAQEFVLELWSSQVIVSELQLTVTGKEPILQLIDSLKLLEGTDHLTAKLRAINTLLQNSQGGIPFFEEVEDKLRQLFNDIEVPKNTLQTDLFLSADMSNINSEVILRVLTQIQDLTALSRKNEVLEDFKKKFNDRFGEKEIPLTIAMDADLGIGYAGIEDQMTGDSEWVNGITQNYSTSSSINFDHINDFSFRKYSEFIRERRSYVEITEKELQSLKNLTKNLRLPSSMYILGELLGNKGELDSSDFTFNLDNISGPSAGRLLGRFTHGDEQLYKVTKALLEEEEEEDKEAIYAEIAHLPQARVGNILLRPILRRYEIPYVGRSGIDKEYQIPINDLTLSLRNNELILWSTSFKKRIVPRLSTAHNFSTESLPIYKFLCDLQFEGIAKTCVWDWGPLSRSKYLPRVTYKNIILKKARWIIEMKDLLDLPTLPDEYFNYFEVFRGKWKIPQKVLFVQSDNKLLIDFNEQCGIQLFLGYLKRFKTVTVEEFLFSKEKCFVKDMYGAPFTNEVVIPIKITGLLKNVKIEDGENYGKRYLRRRFPPLSEWLSIKIYVGSKTLENLLTTHILPFVENGIRNNIFEKFFFLRYRDTQPHLRIRFYNTDLNKQVQLYIAFNRLLQPLFENGVVDNLVIDTYEREVERYNAILIGEAESIFFNDSLAVLQFLNMLEPQESLKYKILIGLRAIDIFLTQFLLSPSEKQELTSKLFFNFWNEYGGESSLRQHLNDKYRANRRIIFSHMDDLQDSANGIEEAIAVFESRATRDHYVIQTILAQDNGDKQLIFKLLHSYLHMFINRLFVSQQRKYELLLYCFLERYYTSQTSMLKKKNP